MNDVITIMSVECHKKMCGEGAEKNIPVSNMSQCWKAVIVVYAGKYFRNMHRMLDSCDLTQAAVKTVIACTIYNLCKTILKRLLKSAISQPNSDMFLLFSCSSSLETLQLMEQLSSTETAVFRSMAIDHSRHSRPLACIQCQLAVN